MTINVWTSFDIQKTWTQSRERNKSERETNKTDL